MGEIHRHNGRITALESEPLGSYLIADAAIGVTSFTLDSVFDFSDDGGDATLQGEAVTYLSRDTDANTITLSAATVDAHEADTLITLVPSARRYIAHVQLHGLDDEVVLADVSHALKPLLPLGIRDDQSQESVLLEERFGVWRVIDVLDADFATAEGTGGNFPRTVWPFFHSGSLIVRAGRSEVSMDRDRTLIGLVARVNTAPTGADIILDLKLSGVSVWASPGDRPRIVAGSKSTGWISNFTTTVLPYLGYLTIDVVQIGSTIKGADLEVIVAAVDA